MRLPKLPKVVGRCYVILLIALLFDVAGLVLLLVGIFASLSAWDFYIYSGAVIIALSMIFWMFWYTFNIELSEKELGIAP